MKSKDIFIQQYRDENPFDFSNKIHEEQFMKMNSDNWELERVKFDIIDGTYKGDVKKDTRIQHGRGIFIEKIKKE